MHDADDYDHYVTVVIRFDDAVDPIGLGAIESMVLHLDNATDAHAEHASKRDRLAIEHRYLARIESEERNKGVTDT